MPISEKQALIQVLNDRAALQRAGFSPSEIQTGINPAKLAIDDPRRRALLSEVHNVQFGQKDQGQIKQWQKTPDFMSPDMQKQQVQTKQPQQSPAQATQNMQVMKPKTPGGQMQKMGGSIESSFAKMKDSGGADTGGAFDETPQQTPMTPSPTQLFNTLPGVKEIAGAAKDAFATGTQGSDQTLKNWFPNQMSGSQPAQTAAPMQTPIPTEQLMRDMPAQTGQPTQQPAIQQSQQQPSFQSGPQTAAPTPTPATPQPQGAPDESTLTQYRATITGQTPEVGKLPGSGEFMPEGSTVTDYYNQKLGSDIYAYDRLLQGGYITPEQYNLMAKDAYDEKYGLAEKEQKFLNMSADLEMVPEVVTQKINQKDEVLKGLERTEEQLWREYQALATTPEMGPETFSARQNIQAALDAVYNVKAQQVQAYDRVLDSVVRAATVKTNKAGADFQTALDSYTRDLQFDTANYKSAYDRMGALEGEMYNSLQRIEDGLAAEQEAEAKRLENMVDLFGTEYAVSYMSGSAGYTPTGTSPFAPGTFTTGDPLEGSSANEWGIDYQIGNPSNAKGAPVVINAPSLNGAVVDSVVTGFTNPNNSPLGEAGKQQNSGWGNTVTLRLPSGEKIQIAHLDAVNVQPGQTVDSSTVLGLQGNTGNTMGSTGVHMDITGFDAAGNYIPITRTAELLGIAKKVTPTADNKELSESARGTIEKNASRYFEEINDAKNPINYSNFGTSVTSAETRQVVRDMVEQQIVPKLKADIESRLENTKWFSDNTGELTRDEEQLIHQRYDNVLGADIVNTAIANALAAYQ